MIQKELVSAARDLQTKYGYPMSKCMRIAEAEYQANQEIGIINRFFAKVAGINREVKGYGRKD